MPLLYSTTCSYAVHAVSRLAALDPERAWRVQEICAGSDLPERFVSKILGDLVRADILTSTKGRGGGFRLTRPAEEIRLIDIVAAIDGLTAYTRCVVGLAECDDQQPCPQHELFQPLRQRIVGYLENTTVRQMSDALIRKAEITHTPLTPAGLPDVTNSDVSEKIA